MTAPKPKPKPRGGQRRPFARQHSSSKDVSRKRFEQQLEDDMIYFDVFPVCTDWKPYKQTKFRVMRIHRHFLLSNDDFPYQTFTFERELCRSRMYFL